MSQIPRVNFALAGQVVRLLDGLGGLVPYGLKDASPSCHTNQAGVRRANFGRVAVPLADLTSGLGDLLDHGAPSRGERLRIFFLLGRSPLLSLPLLGESDVFPGSTGNYVGCHSSKCRSK